VRQRNVFAGSGGATTLWLRQVIFSISGTESHPESIEHVRALVDAVRNCHLPITFDCLKPVPGDQILHVGRKVVHVERGD
jgi:hypothetical protein